MPQGKCQHPLPKPSRRRRPRKTNPHTKTGKNTVKRFNEHGISAWRHRNSPTVVFDRPSQEVFDRWQIAPEGDVAHMITMPHVDFETIDRLVEDCVSPRPEPTQEHDMPPAETGLPAQEQHTEPAHATMMQRIVVMAENRIGVIAQIAGTLAAGGGEPQQHRN